MKIILLFALMNPAFSWHDRTHISVGAKAGYKGAYNFAAPDVAKLKCGDTEGHNHYANNSESTVITADMVKAQIEKYNNGDKSEESGHLYGAIVAAIRAYKADTKKGKYAEYHLAYAGHYCGDLSMPFHNIEYAEFNKKHHSTNDATIEAEVDNNYDKIIITPIVIKTEDDLIANIVIIANKSKELGYKLQKENRDMTKAEAYAQISQSASLFKAIMDYVKMDK